jgi:hypothetical protein
MGEISFTFINQENPEQIVSRSMRMDMDTNSKAARIAGILFISATTATLVGDRFTKPLRDVPEYLVKIYPHKNQFVTGTLLQFIGAVASAAIAVSLYPTLRKFNEHLALGSVVFRIVEGVFYIFGGLCSLSLLPLSRDYLDAGSPNDSPLQALGTLLKSMHNSSGFVYGAGSFCIGALMYYAIFYQSKLIPRWLSTWGIISVVLLFSMVLLIMFGREPSGSILLMAIPLALQEMVFALWLIVKGFDPVVIAHNATEFRESVSERS